MISFFKSIQELFVRSFLIRPTWLSTLALIKTLKNFKSTTQDLPNNSSSLYPELKDLLKELPDKPHEKLARANTDLQLMFMFYLHQTIPAVTISRIMLVMTLHGVQITCARNVDKLDILN